MNDRDDSQSRPAAKSGRDRWIKLAFAAVAVAALILVWQLQRTKLRIPGWGKDVQAALAQARNEGRPVLAFFIADPPSATARRMAKTTLSRGANKQAIKQGRFIRVVVVGSLASDLAKRYKVSQLPTMVIISPQGRLIKSQPGFIGEVPFRAEFLKVRLATSPSDG